MVVLVVSTVGGVATTSIFSCSDPTRSVSGRSIRCPSRTWMSGRSIGAKPCSSACTVYDPGVRNGTVNRPSASLTAIFAPCAPVTVTATPGSGRPCASTVRPASVPPASCAAAAPAMTQPRNASTITTHRFRMTHVSVQPSSTAERALASGGRNPTRENEAVAGRSTRWLREPVDTEGGSERSPRARTRHGIQEEDLHCDGPPPGGAIGRGTDPGTNLVTKWPSARTNRVGPTFAVSYGRPSIAPGRQIRAGRRRLLDALEDLRQVHRVVVQPRERVRQRRIAVPAMLRAIAVLHLAIVGRVLRRLQEVFE